MRKRESIPITGIAWYHREQWPLLRKEAADPEVLEETYEDWLSIAERSVLDMAQEGVRTERVEVDVQELLTWCRTNNRPLDGKARAEFTTRQLRRKHE
jgi:hypothetical protein